MPPQPMGPGGQPLADFGSRLLAYLVDSAIISAVALVLAMPVFLFAFSTMFDDMATATPDGSVPDLGSFIGPILLLEFGLVAVLLVVHYFYYVEMLYRGGQTIGKKVVKLRVIPIDPALRMTRGIAAKRFLAHIVAGTLVPFYSYLDGFWQLWDKPYLQTLHDKFAQTVVVKVGP